MKNPVPFERSERGFARYEPFNDMYGSEIRVIESSNSDGGIWIFCMNDKIDYPTPHLNRAQTEQLIRTLETALSNQSFAEDK